MSASTLSQCFQYAMDALNDTTTKFPSNFDFNSGSRFSSHPDLIDVDEVVFACLDSPLPSSSSSPNGSSSEENISPSSPAIEEEISSPCRRRKNYKQKGKRSGKTRPPIKPSQRNAANERERCRMRVLSKAFSRLKTSLPWVPPDTKLSKLDTLRLAASYIAHLQRILDYDGDENEEFVHPLKLTWPFSVGIRPTSSPDVPSTVNDCMPSMNGSAERF